MTKNYSKSFKQSDLFQMHIQNSLTWIAHDRYFFKLLECYLISRQDQTYNYLITVHILYPNTKIPLWRRRNNFPLTKPDTIAILARNKPVRINLP